MSTIDTFKKLHIDPILKSRLGLVSFVNGENGVITKGVFYYYGKGDPESRIQISADSQIIVSDFGGDKPYNAELEFYYNNSCTPNGSLSLIKVKGETLDDKLNNFCDYIINNCSKRSSNYCRVGASCKDLVIEPRLANQAFTYCVDQGIRVPPALQQQGSYIGDSEPEEVEPDAHDSLNKELDDLGSALKASIIKPTAVMAVRTLPRNKRGSKPSTVAKRLQSLLDFGFNQPESGSVDHRRPPKKSKW